LQSHKVHRAAPNLRILALTQTPAYTARLRGHVNAQTSHGVPFNVQLLQVRIISNHKGLFILSWLGWLIT